MRQFNFLSRLREPQSNNNLFISLYLNTEPNETGKKDFDVYLKKELNDRLAVLEPGSAKRETFETDVNKIWQFVETLDPATRGAAIFACADSNDFFETFEFEMTFPENRLYLFDRAHLLPLVRLMDQNPSFAVVAADTNSAHIYLIKRNETIRREDIQNTKTNRTEVGGWSQMRYQRHVENFHQQHAKEVVEELDRLVRTERIERIVLAGDQAVIVPLLREEMSKELSEKIIDSLPVNVKTPEHELIELARASVEKHDSKVDKKTIEHLSDVNYDEGVGVTGVEATLTALLNGQVQELYLSADPDDIVYRTGDVRTVLKTYMPDESDATFPVGEKELLIDELIKLAAVSAERIRFIEDPHLLKTVGGVGAILRYHAKGVSSV